MRHLAGAARPPDGRYDVDVTILALDRAEETCAAIASALAQDGVSRHVTVLDQGSCPQARAQIARFVQERPGVTFLGIDRNLGVPGGRNRAAAFGHGDAIAGLDNDAEFAAPDTLARARAALAANARIGALGCRILAHGRDTDDLSSWGYPAALLPHAAARFQAATFVGAGHVIRRAAWDTAGGYDPALFFCWEEFDLSLRLLAAGWAVRYHGDLVVTHKVSGEQRVRWSDARWYHHMRNRLYIARKTGADWPSLSPRIAAYLVKGWRNGLLPETRRAIADAARMPLPVPPRPLPEEVRAYLHAVDRAPRGAWYRRIRRELLAPLPAPVSGPSTTPVASPLASPLLAPHAPHAPSPALLSLWQRPSDRNPQPADRRAARTAEKRAPLSAA